MVLTYSLDWGQGALHKSFARDILFNVPNFYIRILSYKILTAVNLRLWLSRPRVWDPSKYLPKFTTDLNRVFFYRWVFLFCWGVGTPWIGRYWVRGPDSNVSILDTNAYGKIQWRKSKCRYRTSYKTRVIHLSKLLTSYKGNRRS